MTTHQDCEITGMCAACEAERELAIEKAKAALEEDYITDPEARERLEKALEQLEEVYAEHLDAYGNWVSSESPREIEYAEWEVKQIWDELCLEAQDVEYERATERSSWKGCG